MPEMVIRSRRVVLPDGVRPASLHVEEGRVGRIADHQDAPADALDVGDSVVMPGLVDTHVHVNEPGRTEWEGFETATRAAAAGGITTVVDMPLNAVPPTTSVRALEEKRSAAEGKCRVDVGFWGGLVPGNLDDLDGLVKAGVCGVKAFLAPSGVDEFPPVDPDLLRAGAARLAGLGVPLAVHAELPEPLEGAESPPDADPRQYLTYLATRPKEAENLAVALAAEIAEDTGAHIHVLHLSSAEAIRTLRQAGRHDFPLSTETCPHYLFFTAEDVPEGATRFKCAPPIRDRPNRDELWNGLARGTVTMVVSDHSPCPPDRKLPEEGDFLRAWGGISSLQLSLPATWTAARHRKHSLEELAGWMAAAPARLAGLDRRKGAIAEGLDADLAIWDPEATFLVEPDRLQHRHPLTPYADRILYGAVRQTILRGEIIYQDGRFPGEPKGRFLSRHG